MKRFQILGSLSALIFPAVAGAGVGQGFGVAIRQLNGTDQPAYFRVYAPSLADVQRLKGTIFIFPGSGLDWRFQADNYEWQQAARAMECALIGGGSTSYLVSDSSTADAAAALNTVLTAAATALNRPELANAPVLSTGFSLGGYTTMKLIERVPSRVVAGVPQRYGTALPAQASASCREVPLLCLPGSKDTLWQTDRDYLSYRGPSYPEGKAAFAVDWLSGHTLYTSQTWSMAWTWMAESFALRYPSGQLPSITPGQPLALLNIPLSSGWLGERSIVIPTPYWTPFPRIGRYSDYTGDKSNASWLPNETVARAYQAFTSHDGIARTTVPYQSPLVIWGDPVPSVVIQDGQPYPPQMRVFPVGTTISMTVNPREFDDVNDIANMELYDGDVLLQTLHARTPTGWTFPHTLTQPGIRTLSVIATDVLGNRSAAFRTLVVNRPYKVHKPLMLEFKFNDSGVTTRSTGTDSTEGRMLKPPGEEADLHGGAGSGVSGRSGDRAFDNSFSTLMGSNGSGGGVDVGDRGSIECLKTFTLQGWFKTPVAVNNAARIFDKNWGIGVNGFVLRTGLAAGELALQVNNVAVTSAASYGAVNEWVFFAVTYDARKSASNVEFFVGKKNQPVTSVGVYTIDRGSPASNEIEANALPLMLGNTTGTSGFTNARPFKGLLDNMRIFGDAFGGTGLLDAPALERLRQGDLNEGATPDLALTLSEGRAEIRFNSYVGQKYQLQRSTSLETGAWTDVAEPVYASGAEMTVVDTSPPTAARLFYRLVVERSYL